MKFTGFISEEESLQSKSRQKELDDPKLNVPRRKYLTKLLENENDPYYDPYYDFKIYLYEEREERMATLF